jgi:TRAP-type C4-dicarboxylate transport system substrate-binding protein
MKKVVMTAAAVVAAVGLGGVTVAEAKTWNLSVWGKKRAFTMGIEQMAAYVEEKSGGKFKIRIAYGSALSKPKENLDGIKLGAFPMAMFCSSYHPAKTPTLSGLDLPFLPIANFDTQRKVSEAYYAHPAVVADLAKWDAMFVMSSILPQYEFMGKGTPPKSMADWNGKQVRALGGMGKAMAAIGAVPATVPAPETYSLVERGAVYAASWPFSYAHVAYKLHEISDWFTSNMSLGSANCPLVVNTKAWSKLEPEYQKLIMEAKDSAYGALKKAYADKDAVNLPMLRKKLTEVKYSDADLAKLRAAGGKPIWDAWIAGASGNGVPAKELFGLIEKTAKGG